MNKSLLRTAKAFSLALACAAGPLWATGLAAALPGDPAAKIPGTPLRVPPPDDWPKYCGNLAMSGAASGDALSSGTASSLVLLWSQKLTGPIASSPSVAGGKVYIGDWGGREWAFDAVTGNLMAVANLGMTYAPACNPSSLGITSAPAIAGSTLYVAGGDDAFYALDADTLAVKWRRSMGDNSPEGGYYGWCSPAVVNDTVLQGISSNCDNPFVPGQLVALDTASGNLVGVADFVPEGVLGSGVWTSPAVDLVSREIFVTTASATNLEDGLSFSIVRVSLETMAIEDSWKVDLHGEQWDADWGSSPTLFTDSVGAALVGAGQKDGHYYAFDRNNLDTGPIWMAPVSEQGDEPQDGGGTLSTAAFDGRTLYVGGGVPADGIDPGTAGTVVAIDPDDGNILWRRTFAGTVIAPVSYANGVIFTTAGNLALGLDARTGETLWSFETKAGCYGGVAIAHGRIYFGDLSGTLYAFGVN